MITVILYVGNILVSDSTMVTVCVPTFKQLSGLMNT